MKVHITRIEAKPANREGVPYLDKNQRPYNRVGIQTQEHDKLWLSGFAYADSPMLAWRIGDEVEIEVEQKGQYTNFRLPRKENGNNNFVIAELKALRAIVEETHKMVSDLVVEPELPDGGPRVEDAQPEESLPF